MSEFDQIALRLMEHIEGDRQRRGAATYGPGAYFYWWLAHHFTADDIRFSDLRPDVERTEYDARYGELVLITDRSIARIGYDHAADSDQRDPTQEFGSASISFRPYSACDVSLAWRDRSLRIHKSRFGPDVDPSPIGPDSIDVAVGDWTLALPGERVPDGDAYFKQLRSAVGL